MFTGEVGANFMTLQMQSALGLIVIPLIAWLISEGRQSFEVKRALGFGVACLALQIGLAALLLYIPGSRILFEVLSQGVVALQAATEQGMRIVFGYLAGGPAPFDVKQPENTYLLAFRGLPLVLTISVLTRLLFYWGVLPAIVRGVAWALNRTLGISGPVGTASAANIFVGMVEAPLLIRPYLKTMSRGGLFATMTVGMATVAGTVLGLYASILGDKVPGAAGHLLVASVISLPAALMISWLMVPSGFEEGPAEAEVAALGDEKSVMDAIVQGALDGMKLLVFIATMLVVMVALVALLNMALEGITSYWGVSIYFEKIMGWVFAPFAWLMGIPVGEMWAAGSFLGVKLVLNEFLAYLQLAQLGEEVLSERSRLIMTYALCGFANFGSLGIMIGGLVALVPERRQDIVTLAPKTLLSGTMATLMTGAVVGILTP